MLDNIFENIKEIPVLISEIYESAYDLGIKGSASLIVSKTAAVAKEVFIAAIYVALLHQHSWLLLMSFTVGAVLPDYVMEKTSLLAAAIFSPKELPPLEPTAKRIEKVCHAIINAVNHVKPMATTGFIGLMALPVLTVQLVAVYAGLRLGAYFGKNADLTKVNKQPLHA